MDPVRNDQINPETRVVGAGVIFILLLAFVALYIYPDRTDVDFAWTIRPRTTAILIGVGYMAGAYFFARVVTGRKWHRVGAGFPAITAFTICMLAATLLHWDRFHQGTFIFYLWFVVYLITPFLVFGLWWRNRVHDPQTLEENDLLFAPPARTALRVIGAAGVLLCLAALIWPALATAVTPWTTSALTARIFAGWGVLASATVFMMGYDGRWSAARILIQSFIVGQVLALLALPRMWPDFDPAHPMTYVFVGGLILALIGLSLAYILLERRCRQV